MSSSMKVLYLTVTANPCPKMASLKKGKIKEKQISHKRKACIGYIKDNRYTRYRLQKLEALTYKVGDIFCLVISCTDTICRYSLRSALQTAWFPLTSGFRRYTGS